jgi:Domain of unknown function (4846)
MKITKKRFLMGVNFMVSGFKNPPTFLMGVFILFCVGCGNQTNSPKTAPQSAAIRLINPEGMSVKTRFDPPEGFERVEVDSASFAYYLQNLPLRKAGTYVKYFNGAVKDDDVYDAVVAMDISDANLQQCADAIMRLRGEYFYTKNQLDSISFFLTNGFKMDYSEWIKGNRLAVSGNKTEWRKTATPSTNYSTFREYMELVFTYAGTLSLSKQLKPKPLYTQNTCNLAIGDVFCVGGSPGHAVIVVDLAVNKNGEKLFLLAQSYMPAQETQILKNPGDATRSPWYALTNAETTLITPEWEFSTNQLKTW